MPAVFLILASMSCVQIGAALSIDLFDELGVSGTAWLRLVWAAALLLAVTRPPLRSLNRTVIALGAATGFMTLAYFGAVARLPLGTATALEFLGP